jgi:hypothetical protein
MAVARPWGLAVGGERGRHLAVRPAAVGAPGHRAVSASSAVSQPRRPNSPPLFPTRTLCLTARGARDSFAAFDVAELGARSFLAGFRVQRNRGRVERL